MKHIIRYTIFFAVICFVFLPSWASNPDESISSIKLASLDTVNTHKENNLSVQHRNSKRYSPAKNSNSQTQPVSEPAAMLILGVGLIGLSIAGRKIYKY